MINFKSIPSDTTGTEHFKEGDIIIEDGDIKCSKMYIITNGSCNVYKNYKQPGEIKVAVLYAGDFFGEMSLFTGKGRTATVVAANDVTVIALNHENARDFFVKNPDATFSLIRDLCSRLTSTNVNLAENAAIYENNLSVLTVKNEELQIAANVDALTRVFNRRYFMENAPGCIKKSAENGFMSYAVLVDIDFFKKVNDTYGHQAGDETLRTVAAIVSNTIRDKDLFARYGGEEFVILLETSGEEEAKSVVENVRLNLEGSTIHFEDLRIYITASFGISPVENAEEFESAIARADAALYRAKETGRNKLVVYAPGMQKA